jgi:hypothetical protein
MRSGEDALSLIGKDMENKEDGKLLDEACKIISNNLGNRTAEYYRDFYQGESNEEITSSLRGLISGLVGETNAKKQLSELISSASK